MPVPELGSLTLGLRDACRLTFGMPNWIHLRCGGGAWRGGNALYRINEVTLRLTRLVLG